MLEIRPITAADHAAWLPLWQGYQRFYNATIAEETSALTWQRFLDPSEPMHAALAWPAASGTGVPGAFRLDRGQSFCGTLKARRTLRCSIK